MNENTVPRVHSGMPVLEAIAGRKSVRGFKSKPVPRETLRSILEAAARAPSGTNTQPWKVYVVEGAAKERVTQAVIAASDAGETSPSYRYSPDKWAEPYLSRRRALGFGLYDLLGIAKNDMEGRKRQHHENYRFFGAPVGLFFTVDQALAKGSWIDIGILLSHVMLAARGFGLETCPQAAWAPYAGAVASAIDLPESDVLVCGMSLGYPDWDAPANALVSQRAPLEDFVTFVTD